MMFPGFPVMMGAPGGLAIGAEFEGGYYVGDMTIGGDDYHLILAPAGDAMGPTAWNSVTTAIPGARSDTDGQANTNAIMAAFPTAAAAAYANGLISGGYTDWYLPSKDELLLAGAAQSVLPPGQDFGGSPDKLYWGSTEMTGPTYPNANFIRGTGLIGGAQTKTYSTNIHVRPMRKVPVVGVAPEGFSGPSVSTTTASFFGGDLVGYIRSGGNMAGVSGVSGGSLSASMLTGFLIDSLFYDGDSFSIIIDGNAVSALVGLSALKVGSTACALKTYPTYDAGNAVTTCTFTGSTSFVGTNTYTIQLI